MIGITMTTSAKTESMSKERSNLQESEIQNQASDGSAPSAATSNACSCSKNPPEGYKVIDPGCKVHGIYTWLRQDYMDQSLWRM